MCSNPAVSRLRFEALVGCISPMIRSMTGYGQASAELLQARLTVELRSVNHRYADIRLRLPQELAAARSGR